MTTSDAPAPGAVVRRTVEIDAQRAAGDGTPIPVSLSSEEPVTRGRGREVLVHEAAAVDMRRARNGLSLLFSHDPNVPIGRVDRIRLEGRRLRGELRFGASARAQEVAADVRSGILRDLSLGYSIDRTEPGRDGEYRVTRWTPLEASVVSIAADPTVGVGRSHQHTLENRPMTNISTHETDPQFPDRTEEERVASIRRLAQHRDSGGKLQYNGAAIAGGERAIAEGWSTRDYFRWAEKHCPYEMIDPIYNTPDTSARLGMSPKETKRFSLHRAIRAMASGDWRDAGFELEASDSVAQKLGRRARGLFIPTEVLGARAIAKSGTGGDLIETSIAATSFIELLRNASRVLEAGATVLPDLRGDVAIPRRTASATAQWLTEAGNVTGSDSTFDQVLLTPKTVAARTDMTRKMLLQSTPAVEEITRRDLAASLGTAVDLAALFGTGASNQPTGINARSGIGLVAIGTNGGAATWAHVVALESAVANANADGGRLGYVTNSKVRGSLKVAEKATGTAQFVWPDAATAILNGHPAFVTNQVPSNLTKGSGTDLSAMIFGNFADLLIGEWGVLDIFAERFTLADSGGAVVRAFYDVDIAVRHPESFAVIRDIVTA